MGFYDRLKSALSGTGATVRQIVPDAKQAASGEQLPYEATFGDTPIEQELAVLWGNCKAGSAATEKIVVSDARDFCDALMESMSAWKPEETPPTDGRYKSAWLSAFTGGRTVAGVDSGHPPEVTYFLARIIHDSAVHACGADAEEECMLEGPPGMRLQTTAVGALISMQRSWYNRLALRRCSGLSLLSASLQRCAACISSPGVDGSLPSPDSQPAALLELIINILNAYVKSEAKQFDISVERGEPARHSPDPTRMHAHTRGAAAGAVGASAGSGGLTGGGDGSSAYTPQRSGASSSDSSTATGARRPVAAAARMSVEGAVGALRGGVEGGQKAELMSPSARFAAAVEALPPVAVSCAAALRALGGPEGRCWTAESSPRSWEDGDGPRWQLFLQQATNLVELLASRSPAVADDLLAAGVLQPLCSSFTSVIITQFETWPLPQQPTGTDATAAAAAAAAAAPAAAAGAATAAAGTAAPAAATPVEQEVEVVQVTPSPLPRALAALRALRYLAACPLRGGSAANELLKRGVFPAICRFLIQAAAVAEPDSGNMKEAAPPDEGAVNAAAKDAGCNTPEQTRVFRSVMAKLPLTLARRGPMLHALMMELAMWLVVHSRGERSADALAPLCSAILDCFAVETKSMRLEQPASLAAQHQAMLRRVVATSADVQRCSFAFLSVLLEQDARSPTFLHTLHLGPVLLGPCFFQHSMSEEAAEKGEGGVSGGLSPGGLFQPLTIDGAAGASGGVAGARGLGGVGARSMNYGEDGISPVVLGDQQVGSPVKHSMGGAVEASRSLRARMTPGAQEQSHADAATGAAIAAAAAAADALANDSNTATGAEHKEKTAAEGVFTAAPTRSSSKSGAFEKKTGFTPVPGARSEASPAATPPKVASRSQLSESLSNMAAAATSGDPLPPSIPNTPSAPNLPISPQLHPQPRTGTSAPDETTLPHSTSNTSLPIAIHPPSCPPYRTLTSPTTSASGGVAAAAAGAGGGGGGAAPASVTTSDITSSDAAASTLRAAQSPVDTPAGASPDPAATTAQVQSVSISGGSLGAGDTTEGDGTRSEWMTTGSARVVNSSLEGGSYVASASYHEEPSSFQDIGYHMERSVSATGAGSPSGGLAEGSYCDVGAFLTRGGHSASLPRHSTSMGNAGIGPLGPPGGGAMGSPGLGTPGGAAGAPAVGPPSALVGTPLATPSSAAVYGPAALMHQASFGHRPVTPGGGAAMLAGVPGFPPTPQAQGVNGSAGLDAVPDTPPLTAGAAAFSIRSLDATVPEASDDPDTIPVVLRPNPPSKGGLPPPVLTELRQTALQLYELWVIQCTDANVPGASDLLMQSLHERVRRAMPFARPLACLVLDLLYRLCQHHVREPCAASLIRCRALHTSVNLIEWLHIEASRTKQEDSLLEASGTEPATPRTNTVTLAIHNTPAVEKTPQLGGVKSAGATPVTPPSGGTTSGPATHSPPPPLAGGASDDPSPHAVALQLRRVLCSVLSASPAAAPAMLESERSVGKLFARARSGWHDVAVPVLSALLFAAPHADVLTPFAARYLKLLKSSLSLPAGFSVTKELLHGLQQQRRTRTAGTQTLQTTLRKLRALDVILTVGRGVKHPDKGTAAGEEVLVESMQCLLALVQGNEEMRMHFRHDVDVRKVMALVRDCMGSAKVQRNVLEVVLGIVLEAKYDAQQAVSQIVNADAAPLFFRMLMQASVGDALWGLAVWLRLVSVDVVSAQSCGRAAIFPLLLSWFRASSALERCSPRLRKVSHTSMHGVHDDGEIGECTHPLLQARLALLLRALAPHAMATSDIRSLFHLLQPVLLPSGENGSIAQDSNGSCWTWDAWRQLLAGKVPEAAVLPREAVIVQRLLYWMAQDDVPAAFLHISNQISEYSGGSGGFLCKSPPPISLGSVTFCAWMRLGRGGGGPEDGLNGVGQNSDGLQSVLVLLSDDPSLRRSRSDLPAASGICAFVKGGRIVIASVAAGSHTLALGKSAPNLPECKWFHLALVFDSLGSGIPSGMVKVTVIVDGQPVEMATVKMPKVGNMAFCGVCTTVELPSGDTELMRVPPMHGQLACVHFFDIPLQPTKVRAVQSLGPNYLGVFHPREAAVATTGSGGTLQAAFTGRGSLPTSLAAAFAPLAHDSRSLVDFSMRGQHQLQASKMAGTTLCHVLRPRELLHALGGVAALLPLILLLQVPALSSRESSPPLTPEEQQKLLKSSELRRTDATDSLTSSNASQPPHVSTGAAPGLLYEEEQSMLRELVHIYGGADNGNGLQLHEILDIMHCAVKSRANLEALARNNCALVAVLALLLRRVAPMHLSARARTALQSLATSADVSADVDLSSAIWRTLYGDFRLWRAVPRAEQVPALRALLGAARAPPATSPGVPSPMHAAVPVATVVDAIRQEFRPDAFLSSPADPGYTPPRPGSPLEDGMHTAPKLYHMNSGRSFTSQTHTPRALESSTSSLHSQPSQLVIALMGSLSVAPASSTKAVGGTLALTQADYTAILSFVSDCSVDDTLLASFLTEIYNVASRNECSARFRALAAPHRGPVPYLPLLSRADPALRCAALMLIAVLAPSTGAGGSFLTLEEHASVWRAVSGHIAGSWRLSEGDTKDTLLTVLAGGPSATGTLQTKELVIPTLRLIAACPDAEVRHSALEGFRNLVESSDAKCVMLTVPGWTDALLDILPRPSGTFSPATTPTSTCMTHRSTRSVRSASAPPAVDTSARKLLEGLLTYSVVNMEQGAGDVDSVTCGLRRMHSNGELVGDACLASILATVVQALVAADSQLWDRAMSEAPNSARGSAPPLEDRDDEWLLVIAEPRATNLLAVASIVHEFIAGALFVPALDSAELLPSSSAISWAHKNWLYQDPQAMVAFSTPSERRECLHPHVFAQCAVEPPPESLRKNEPKPLHIMPPLPSEAWNMLVPQLWKFATLLMTVVGSRPREGGDLAGGGSERGRFVAAATRMMESTGLGGASAAQNSAPAPPVDTSGVAQTTDNPLFKSAGAELTGDDSDSAAHGSGVGGGVATGGGAPIAVRATAKVAEAEMVAAGRATLPFRICMLILLRALDLQASACHQVYKDSSRAMLTIVSKSGSLYFNHVHLFCLLLSEARRARISGNKDKDGALKAGAGGSNASSGTATSRSGNTEAAEAARKESDREYAMAIDSCIVQFRETVAYSLKEAARVSSILRQPKDFAYVVSNIMPSRVQAAAAVEVLWRAHYIVQRQVIDASVDQSASDANEKVDDAPGLLLGVMTSAQDVLAAATTADSIRRADAAAAQHAADAAAHRTLHNLVKRLTSQRQAWAPPDSAPLATTASTAPAAASTPRRVTAATDGSAVSSTASAAAAAGGGSSSAAAPAAARAAAAAAGDAEAGADAPATSAADAAADTAAGPPDTTAVNGNTANSDEPPDPDQSDTGGLVHSKPPSHPAVRRVSDTGAASSTAESPHCITPMEGLTPRDPADSAMHATHERVCELEDSQRRCLHMEDDHDYVRYTDADAQSSAGRVSASGSAHVRSEDELRKLPKGARAAVHGGNELHGEDEEGEDTEGDGANTQGEDGSKPAEQAAEPSLNPAQKLMMAAGEAARSERVVIDGCVLVRRDGEVAGQLILGATTVAFVAADPSASCSWSLVDIAEVYHARYLLQPRALQIFFYPLSGVPPALVATPTTAEMTDIGAAIAAAAPHAQLYDRRRALSAATAASRRWANGEISNFDYLMLLNTLSGRSHSDLAQYPVFPWVLQDWVAEKIDLSDPGVYRDLGRPIGALNEERLERFQERYASLLGDENVAPFFYGTHYSSAGIVLWYLLRMAPYTALAHSLQGGRFDHADRLFTSLPRAWAQVLKNSSDVKEMIPEFYYNPAFLRNHAQLPLGTMHSGEPVGDVGLPAWANGSVHEFIRIHREALESDFVSARLNEWIDLIWGFKQRGPAAVDACNVFHALTYEGAVTMSELEDAATQRAVLDQIREFGQTPMQLFRRKHPKKTPTPPAAAPLLHSPDTIQRCQGAAWCPGSSHNPVAAMMLVDTSKGGRLVHIDSHQRVLVHKWHNTSNVMAYTFSAHVPSDYIIEPSTSQPRDIGSPGAKSPQRSAAAYASIPHSTYIVSGGHWDSSLRVIDVETAAVKQVTSGHHGPVTCLSVMQMEGSKGTVHVLVAGARDALLSVWPITSPSNKSKSANPLPSTPCHFLYGHDAPITALATSSGLRTAVSAATNGTLLLHHVPTGKLLRVFPKLPRPVSLVAISDVTPAVVSYCPSLRRLHCFHIQGEEIATLELGEMVSCMHVSPCGRMLLVAGERTEGGGGPAAGMRKAAAPLLLWLHNLQVVMRFQMQLLPDEGDITAMVVSREGCLIVGTSRGDIVLLSPDPRRNITARPNLADCSR